MKKCVFAGSFDPPTTGHKQVVENCLKIFDEVVVALLINPDKTALFTADERTALLKKLFANEKKVRVVKYGGAAVDLLEEENTPFYVRGVRNAIDFDYENMNFFANKKLKKDIVTIYFPAGQDSLHVSSSLVRNSYKFKKNFSEYIPEEILKDIEKLLKDKEDKNV